MSKRKQTFMDATILYVLKELRKEKKLTLKEVADAMMSSTSMVHRYENGESELSLKMFFEMCKTFETEPGDVIKVAQVYDDLFTINNWELESTQGSLVQTTILNLIFKLDSLGRKESKKTIMQVTELALKDLPKELQAILIKNPV